MRTASPARSSSSAPRVPTSPSAGPGWGGGKRTSARSSSSRCRTTTRRPRRGTARRRRPARRDAGVDTRARRREPALPRGDHPPLDRRGPDRSRRRRWRATEDVGEIVIPDTVQAVLAARIDLLPAVERSALLSASVVGRVFWSGSVARLLDDANGAADEALGRLEDRDSCSRSSGRESPASASSSSSTSSRATLRTARSHGGTVPGRTRMSPPGSSPPRGSASVSSPTCSHTTSGSRTRDPSPTRPLLRTVARSQAALPRSSPGRLHRGTEQDAARQGERVRRSGARRRRRRARAVTRTGGARPVGSEGLSRRRLLALLSQAVDERIAGGRGSGEGIAMLCARAVESPTRWPASMCPPPGLEDVRRYVEIGLEHADAEGEARVRLLIARSMWIFAFGGRGSRGGRRRLATRGGGGVRARGGARAGRPRKRGARRSPEHRVHRRPAWADLARRRAPARDRRATDRSVGDRRCTADGRGYGPGRGRYEDARRWASEGFERARGGPDVWRAGLAWRAIARFSSATGTERSRTTSAWRRRAL